MGRNCLQNETVCKACGKHFFPTGEWVYRNRGEYVCSWKCLRQMEKKRGRDSTWRARITDAQRAEAIGRLQNGDKCKEISQDLNVSLAAIQRLKKELKEGQK